MSLSPHLFGRSELVRFGRFLIVGGLNTLVGYSLFAGLTLTGASPALAAIGSTMLGVLFNFRSIGRIVFLSSDHRLFPRFIGVYFVQYCVNVSLLAVCAAFGIRTLCAQALLAPFLAVLTYILVRRYVFRKVEPHSEAVS